MSYRRDSRRRGGSGASRRVTDDHLMSKLTAHDATDPEDPAVAEPEATLPAAAAPRCAHRVDEVRRPW